MTKLNLKFLVVALAVIILIMFGLWRPWEEADARTIEVTGEAELTAEPDEFIFNVTYQKVARDQKTAIAAVSALGNEVASRLKELGVEEKKITTNVSSNSSGGYEPEMPVVDDKRGDKRQNDDSSFVAVFNIRVVVNDKALAQKVTDYIATTPTEHAVTPEYTFSSKKRQELEAKARSIALLDGKKKALETAKALGVELGKVQKVSEVKWGGGIVPLEGQAIRSDATSSPIVFPGEQEIRFSVTITYKIK
jgi:uncharacterized protein YggE